MEDSDFIKKYAIPAEKTDGVTTFGTKTKNVSGSKSNSKIAVTIKGTITADIGIINNSFGGNVTTTVTKGTPTVIKTKIRHVAYGAIGSRGTIVGKVQDKTLTSTCKDIKTCNNQKSFRYTASVAYATTYAEATDSYSGGSLDVEAK